MKKVLFVINTLGQGGAEMALIELLKHFRREDMQVSLLVLTGQGVLKDRIPEDVKILNRDIFTHSLYDATGRKHLIRQVIKSACYRGTILRSIPYLTGNLCRMIRKKRIQPDKLLWKVLANGTPKRTEHYDLAVAFLEGGATYYVADRVEAAKKAAFLHIDYTQAGYDPKLDGQAYAAFDRIYSVSQEVRKAFLQVYPQYEEKSEVFYNFLDEERIRRLSEESTCKAWNNTRENPDKALCESGEDPDKAGQQPVRLLTIGRLTMQKAYDVSIRAFAQVKAACNFPIKWYVIGEGEQRKYLENCIEELGLTEDFILLGNRENPYPYLREADLYVHTSRFEGKSLAIQEAQVLGKPILVSDCSGNREQVRKGVDGWICPFTSEEIAQAIIQILQMPDRGLAMGQRAMEKSQNDYEQLRKLYALLEE